MTNLKTRTRIIIGAIIIVVIAFALFEMLRHNSDRAITDETVQNDTPTSTEAAGAVLSSTGENTVAANQTLSPSTSTVGNGIPAIAAPAITINLLTPIANNLWTIGQQNPIAWSAPANISGEIDLVDAKTKTFVGVIISNIGPNETSYIWDGRSIYLGRYSADKKDVVPGIYSIRIHFDGNGLGDLVSGPITISK